MSLTFSDGWLSMASTGFAYSTIANSYTVFGAPHSIQNPSNIASLAGSGNSLSFYQGSLPTTTQMNTFIPNIRASDMILQFTSTNTCVSAPGKSIVLNFGGTLGNIINPGTMTWFSISNSSTSFVNCAQFFGTVGLSGSGADLILPKVNVISNDIWICTNLWFNLGNSPVQV